MPLKMILSLILLSVPLCAHASDEKGWYPFMENKGWYGWEGQSGSASSTGNKDQPLVQPTTQPASNSTQPMTNTSSQTGNQQTQSSWFK